MQNIYDIVHLFYTRKAVGDTCETTAKNISGRCLCLDMAQLLSVFCLFARKNVPHTYRIDGNNGNCNYVVPFASGEELTQYSPTSRFGLCSKTPVVVTRFLDLEDNIKRSTRLHFKKDIEILYYCSLLSSTNNHADINRKDNWLGYSAVLSCISEASLIEFLMNRFIYILENYPRMSKIGELLDSVINALGYRNALKDGLLSEAKTYKDVLENKHNVTYFKKGLGRDEYMTLIEAGSRCIQNFFLKYTGNGNSGLSPKFYSELTFFFDALEACCSSTISREGPLQRFLTNNKVDKLKETLNFNETIKDGSFSKQISGGDKFSNDNFYGGKIQNHNDITQRLRSFCENNNIVVFA